MENGRRLCWAGRMCLGENIVDNKSDAGCSVGGKMRVGIERKLKGK